MPDKVSIVRRTGCPHVDQLNENGQWIIRESLGECQHKKHRGDVTLDSKYPSIRASEHPSFQVSSFEINPRSWNWHFCHAGNTARRTRQLPNVQNSAGN